MDDRVRKKRVASTRPSCPKTASMLHAIASSTSGAVADAYFEALAASLAENLGMEFVCIGILTGGKAPRITAKVAVTSGKPMNDFSYLLAGTPCEKALSEKACCYPENVQAQFPDDEWLGEEGIESYIGAALISSAGEVMGILSAFSQLPIQNLECVTACFDMVVARTAAELERTQTEEKLRELAQVVEQSPVIIAKADLDGQLIYVNKSFEKATGYKASDVLGKNARVLTSGTASDELFEDVWKSISRGDIWKGEILNKRKDGSAFWAKATFGPLKNRSGEVSGYISIKEEITERKENEKQLRLAASVFETASEALVVTGVDKRIKRVNQAFSAITGYSRDEAIGQTPAMLQSGRHGRAFYRAMFKSLAEKGEWEGEIWNRRKNGEIYPEWLKITAIRDDFGNLEGYVGLFSDISKRKYDESLIRHQANFDALTGLANRNLFLDRLSRSLELAEKNDNHVALLFIDIDRFKHVNDTLGHSTGDQLLQIAANRLTAKLSKPATVARFGGDEFVVVLPDEKNLHHIEDTVVKILAELERPQRVNGNLIFSSASIGVSVYPVDGRDTETLLRKADNAMHKAKEKGRNNFQFFTQEMDIEAQRRRELERDLYKAVERNQLTLVFQPILDASSDRIVSAEALVRWQHPEKGLIPPSEFIPLAEEVGLINRIGEWVLRKACEEALSWTAITGNPPGISVNLSGIQFKKQNIPLLVSNVLYETGLPPERLTLEITESLLVDDDNGTLKQLQGIRELGVGLSIDDFGTGYSSLSYLKRFPVTMLKIDRSFVMGVVDNAEDQALVSAILAMAHSLGLKVVAEGVETTRQYQFLRDNGCGFVQGFLFSQPLPQHEFVSWLKQSLKKRPVSVSRRA